MFDRETGFRPEFADASIEPPAAETSDQPPETVGEELKTLWDQMLDTEKKEKRAKDIAETMADAALYSSVVEKIQTSNEIPTKRKALLARALHISAQEYLDIKTDEHNPKKSERERTVAYKKFIDSLKAWDETLDGKQEWPLGF